MSRRRSPRGPWPRRAIRPVLDAARSEAELAGHGYVGVEHLLLALTRAQVHATATLLADHGITGEPVREAVRDVVGSGRGDGPRLGPAALLATLGIDLDQIRRHVEAQFGPEALHDLYTSREGWNLRPRGPLCDLGMSPQLKQVLEHTFGRCWNGAPPQMHERLLLHALNADSPGLAAIFGQLDVDAARLATAVTALLKVAS